MILADLFKPNKYGTEAIVNTLAGDVLTLRYNLVYISKAFNADEEYPTNTPVEFIPHTGVYVLDKRDGGQHALQVLYLLKATPENILVALTLEHQ